MSNPLSVSELLEKNVALPNGPSPYGKSEEISPEKELFERDFPGIAPAFRCHHLNPESKRALLYRKMMEKRYGLKKLEAPAGIYWDAEHFGVTNSSLFQKLDPEQKHAYIKRLNERILAGSLFIERSGLEFGARMILEADSIEERSLYAVFAEEESRHFMEFNRFVDFPVTKDHHWQDTLDPLGEVIKGTNKKAAIYLIHVLLEGFSFPYYNVIMQNCQEPLLRESYKRILEDEARHHAMGLMQDEKPTRDESEEIFEKTRRFIDVLLNTHPTLTSYQSLFGNLSSKEIERFNEETTTRQRRQQRAMVFDALIKRNDIHGMHERLVKDGAFAV